MLADEGASSCNSDSLGLAPNPVGAPSRQEVITSGYAFPPAHRVQAPSDI